MTKNNLAMTIYQAKKKYACLPAVDVEILIAHTIHKSKEFIFTYPESNLSLWQQIRLRYFIHLHKRGYSTAAITGHKEFYGLDFFVNKKVLIPRPETELMVEETLVILNNELRINNDKLVLIDIGTGSGCIPISILKNLSKPVQTFAIDISRSALSIARKNAQRHNVAIQFLHGSLLQSFLSLRATKGTESIPRFGSINNGIAASPRTDGSPRNNTIVMTANLPYLNEQQFQNERSIQREPKAALVAKNNGLALYEELLQQTKSLIGDQKISVSAFLEIDPSQTAGISLLIRQILPEARVEIKKDLAGLDRLVTIKI